MGGEHKEFSICNIILSLNNDCFDTDPSPRDPVLWRQYTNTHRLHKSYGEKGDAWPLYKLERGPLDPRLDRLLLFFWAHYMEDDPHLLCTGSPQVIDYLLKTTKDRTLLITSKRRMLQFKGEAAHTPYLGGLAQILER